MNSSEESKKKITRKRRYSRVKTLEGWPTRSPQGIDFAFIKTVFDIRPLLFPMTRKKIGFFVVYFSIISALIWLEMTWQLSKKMNDALNEQVLWLSVLTYGLEPFMLILYMIFSRYPYFHPKLMQIHNSISSNHDTVLVIPCHHSASSALETQSLKKVIASALLHFTPSHIIVVDNGEEAQPVDHTEEVIVSPQKYHLLLKKHSGNLCPSYKNRRDDERSSMHC